MSKPTIVFFGTGPVAAKSLQLLLDHFTIEAVITKPKPDHHKGNFPVLQVAETQNLNIIEVTDKQSVSNAINQTVFKSSVAVLIDFGIIVTKDVIEAFEYGIINSHFSLLPQWRGADPITFAILSGQQKSGVSLMLIDEGMDTGKILAQKSLAIDKSETTSSLTEKLIILSDEMLQTTLSRYLNGDIKPRRQPHPDRATYSRKISKQDGEIDWAEPAVQIEREIRAFDSWPKSHTKIADKDVSILKASVVRSSAGKAGTITITNDKNLCVSTPHGSLIIEELKPAGKPAMSASAFLAGHRSKL